MLDDESIIFHTREQTEQEEIEESAVVTIRDEKHTFKEFVIIGFEEDSASLIGSCSIEQLLVAQAQLEESVDSALEQAPPEVLLSLLVKHLENLE